MNYDAMQSVLKGNIEALDQGVQLLNSLSDEQYKHIAAPYVSSSIGQHFRHVVDMFLAIVNRVEGDPIDFDERRRGAEIETRRTVALEELQEVRRWMCSIVQRADLMVVMSECLGVKTEVTLKETESVQIESTLARELIFAGSHAVHHYALIGVIAKLQGVSLSADLGVAPATASHLRAVNQHDDEKASALACAQ